MSKGGFADWREMSPRGKVIGLLMLALFWVLVLGGIAFVGLNSPRDPHLGRPERTKVSVSSLGLIGSRPSEFEKSELSTGI